MDKGRKRKREMSSQFNSDEEMLGQLIRKAGHPFVEPDPQYSETLRAMILDRVGWEQSTVRSTETVRKVGSSSAMAVERAQTMKRIFGLAITAIVLLAVGMVAFWGGTGSIACAGQFAAYTG